MEYMCFSDVCPNGRECPDCGGFVCGACFTAVLDKIENDPHQQAILKALWEHDRDWKLDPEIG